MIGVHAPILNASLLFTWGTRDVSTLSQEQSRMLTVSITIKHGSEANTHFETNENGGRIIVKETKLSVDGKAVSTLGKSYRPDHKFNK